MGLDDRVAQMQANGAPILPSAAPMTNPPGFQYTPNVNGQMVVAPPGHPAHSGVPAGYQYPPGAVPVAGGVVEVPQTPAPQYATPVQPIEVVTLPPEAAAAAEHLAEHLAEHVAEAVEKPKRTRRTKAEIEAEKAAQAFGPPAEGVTRVICEADRTITEYPDEPHIGRRDGMSVAGARGIDGAVETLAARSKELGCDIQVNIVMKGGQS